MIPDPLISSCRERIPRSRSQAFYTSGFRSTQSPRFGLCLNALLKEVDLRRKKEKRREEKKSLPKSTGDFEHEKDLPLPIVPTFLAAVAKPEQTRLKLRADRGEKSFSTTIRVPLVICVLGIISPSIRARAYPVEGIRASLTAA